MQVLPAVDLMGGRAVRLKQGRKNEKTEYYDDPVQPALNFARTGARWLHVVDLDGAFEGEGKNTEVVRRIVQAVSPLGMKVELGGGIRNLERIEQVLELGVSRAILGTVIYTDAELLPSAVKKFGASSIVAGIDASGGKVAIRGWEEVTERDAIEVAAEVRSQGCERVIYTDIATDGMLGGPNIPALEAVASVGMATIASGGVSTLDNVRAVAKLAGRGIEGMIVGRAFYEGTMELTDALVAAGSDETTEKN
jgi:phosphoribosylformimino-5-aminoimidazole carboxamide ribotide isomerase